MSAMSKRNSNPYSSFGMPFMAMQLAMSSWEVIARRTMMMAQNRCSPHEYQRMMLEKLQAVQQTGITLATSGGMPDPEALMRPWHRRAVANAKRLRRT
jgi:hypothetical protein